MRLVCPNCEAKYEVPEDAIPETGRDVQCANCGHAWFQMRSRPIMPEPAPAEAAPVVTVPEAADIEATPEPEVVAPAAEPVEVATEVVAAVTEAPVAPALVVEEADLDAATETDATSDTDLPDMAVEEPIVPEIVADAGAVESSAAAEATETVDAGVSSAEPLIAEVPISETPADEPPADEALGDETPVGGNVEPEVAEASAVEEEPDPGSAPVGEATVYAVDESVLAILREEAAREAQARRVEVRPLEVQSDLGIEAAMLSARKAVEVISADTADADGPDAGDGKPAARRDLLPDVEEINSTLRPSDHPSEEDAGSANAAPAIEARSGFRSGFLLVMTVTILATALYVSADALSAAIPALAGPLETFVGFVDGLRLQLDGLMQNATVAINGDDG